METDPLVLNGHTDRILGSFTGLFIGDALGTTLEFSERDSLPHHEKMIGGGPFDLEPGEWTDDGSMALCLAASLVETKTFDPLDQLQRYVHWKKEGYMSSNGRCFDIGVQTDMALQDFIWYKQPYWTRFKANQSGNGGLMRLSPAALAFSHDTKLAGRVSELSSRTTHPSEACVEAARVLGEAIVVGVQTGDKQQVINHVLRQSETVKTRNMKTLTGGSFINAERKNISSSGYVVTSLEAALWALHNTDTFNDGLVLAVNLGHDADTIGAIYGQLAGACYGKSTIREDWLQTLQQQKMINHFGLQIAQNVGNFTIREFFRPPQFEVV